MTSVAPHPPSSARGVSRNQAYESNSPRRPSTNQSRRGTSSGGSNGFGLGETRPFQVSERLYPASQFEPSGQYQEERAHKMDLEGSWQMKRELQAEKFSAQRSERKKEIEALRSEDNVFVSGYVKDAIAEEKEVRKILRQERKELQERIHSPATSERRRRTSPRTSPRATIFASSTTALPKLNTATAADGQTQRTARSRSSANDTDVSSRKTVTLGGEVLPAEEGGNNAAEANTTNADARKQPIPSSPRRPKSEHQHLTYLDRVKINHTQKSEKRREEREKFLAERAYLQEIAAADKEADRLHKLNNRGFVDIGKQQQLQAKEDDMAKKRDVVKKYREYLEKKEAERRRLREEEQMSNAQQAQAIAGVEKTVPESVQIFKDKKVDQHQELRTKREGDVEEASQRRSARETAAREVIKTRRDMEKKDKKKFMDDLHRRRRENAAVIDEESVRNRREVAREKEEFRQMKTRMRNEARELSASRQSSRSPEQRNSPVQQQPSPRLVQDGRYK